MTYTIRPLAELNISLAGMTHAVYAVDAGLARLIALCPTPKDAEVIAALLQDRYDGQHQDDDLDVTFDDWMQQVLLLADDRGIDVDAVHDYDWKEAYDNASMPQDAITEYKAKLAELDAHDATTRKRIAAHDTDLEPDE